MRNCFLLLASLLFYAWGEPVYVFLMLASILGNYLLGLGIDAARDKKRKNFLLILAVVLNLGVLFYFKYLNFLVDSLNLLLGTRWGVETRRLPIGISFFTFQAMSYVIDVYRGTSAVQRNVLHLGLYISFFPQLIAGPIVRYNTIEAQIRNRTVTMDKFQQGICRFIEGFSKKIILANVMSVTAESVFAAAGAGSLSVLMAWLGALAYTFQIYFDFSGYSDMAIGLGRMFGFEFQENFRYPYLSKSVSEFWNRWHISLGQWFRDYVYFPLGGSRVTKGKLVRNLFVVWLLTGIWHGAAWRFILWGVGYGTIITLEKLTGFPKKNKNKTLAVLYSIFTFLTVVVGWVIFGAPGLKTALYQLGAMVGIGAEGLWDAGAVFTLSEYLPYFLGAAVFSTPVPKMGMRKLKTTRFGWLVQPLVYLGLLMLSFSFLAIGSHNPFIYFNF